jgi:hypothetical protein
MFSKPVSDITAQDLQELIGLSESDRLEFKSQAYDRGDPKTLEMLRDITAFANAVGGYLILGIEEDGEDRATAIVGLENAEEEATRMMSCCLASIEDRILGLNFTLVPVGEGKQVIVWFIPRGTRAPHMITYKGMQQCWRRHGRQKHKMTIEEIREACLRTENVRRNLEDFLGERRGKILAQIGDQPHLVVTATPLIVKDETIDTADPAVRSLMAEPPDPFPLQDAHRIWFRDEQVAPSLYGLVAEHQGWRRLEVFRNAHAEFRVRISGETCFQENVTVTAEDKKEYTTTNRYGLATYPGRFLHFVRALGDHAGLTEPIVVGLSIFNARGLRLAKGRPDSDRRWTPSHLVVVTAWKHEQHLDIPPMQFPYPLDPGKVAKRLADRLWQAFHYDNCPLLDEHGQPVE